MNKQENLQAFLEHKLNINQQKAAQHTNGPMLVVAGAGSGKTRVITARITHLILNKSVNPKTILALTFTNKAAREMKERIEHFLGVDSQLPFIGTFHSYCVQLLKKHQKLLETPFFSILDQDDRTKLLSGILQRNNLNKQFTAKQLGYQISHIKNHSIEPSTSNLFTENRLLAELYNAYEQEKTVSKCLDFDDLLLRGLQLFTANKEFKQKYHQTIRHILVDEYQDTNVVQHALLKQMCLDKKKFIVDSLCAVGDEDQSIYSWRGATVANILNFKKDFPETDIITLAQNYRSVQPILQIANKIITHNTKRNSKQLFSEKKGIDRIRHLATMSEYQEGDVIAACAQAAQKKNSKQTVAVLYRTHFQSRAIEEALIKASIPYKIIGGIQFYERKEIKDLLAYLRLVVNPFDRASLFRVINCPARGLGPKFEGQLYEHWAHEPFLTCTQVCSVLIEQEIVTGKKAESVQAFVNTFSSITVKTSPKLALEAIITKTGYISYLKDKYELEDAQNRIDNVNELLNAIAHFEAGDISTIEQFLDEVALMQEHKKTDDENHNPVLLMSLHAAKGLEFDTVILSGLEDGLLPSSRSLQHPDQIEEERRLLYVGITRAKERLFLTRSRYRYSYGQMNHQRASRFLKEIPATLAPEEDVGYWNGTQVKQFFAKWFGITPTTSVFTFGKNNTSAFKTSATKKITPARKLTPGRWKKNQPVSHKKFGIGTVQKVEKKGKNTYLSIKFKMGLKKIDSSFVQSI